MDRNAEGGSSSNGVMPRDFLTVLRTGDVVGPTGRKAAITYSSQVSSTMDNQMRFMRCCLVKGTSCKEETGLKTSKMRTDFRLQASYGCQDIS